MISRALAGLGLVVLPTVLCCSSDDSPPASGSGGTGAAAGDAPGGSKAQAGSAGSGAGTAGNPSAGSSAGGSAAQGGGAGVAGSSSGAGGGGAGGEVSIGGAPGEGGAGGEGGPDPGGGQVIEACLDAPVVADTRTEALEFSGAGLTAAIVRRVDPDAFGTSGTTVWLAQRFGLVRNGVAECITDVASLDYTVSHHNFDDAMTASHGAETWTFAQTRQDYGFPAMFSLEARSGNALVWGPVTLTLVGCQELLQGESCLTRYLE